MRNLDSLIQWQLSGVANIKGFTSCMPLILILLTALAHALLLLIETRVIYYRSLAKKGPWAVHLTLGSDRGVGRHSRYQYSVIQSISPAFERV